MGVFPGFPATVALLIVVILLFKFLNKLSDIVQRNTEVTSKLIAKFKGD